MNVEKTILKKQKWLILVVLFLVIVISSYILHVWINASKIRYARIIDRHVSELIDKNIRYRNVTFEGVESEYYSRLGPFKIRQVKTMITIKGKVEDQKDIDQLRSEVESLNPKFQVIWEVGVGTNMRIRERGVCP